MNNTRQNKKIKNQIKYIFSKWKWDVLLLLLLLFFFSILFSVCKLSLFCQYFCIDHFLFFIVCRKWTMNFVYFHLNSNWRFLLQCPNGWTVGVITNQYLSIYLSLCTYIFIQWMETEILRFQTFLVCHEQISNDWIL